MRIEIVRDGDEQFEPFDVTFSIESIDEARLLYHVLNETELRDTLLNSGYGSCPKKQPIAKNLCCDDSASIRKFISVVVEL